MSGKGRFIGHKKEKQNRQEKKQILSRPRLQYIRTDTVQGFIQRVGHPGPNPSFSRIMDSVVYFIVASPPQDLGSSACNSHD